MKLEILFAGHWTTLIEGITPDAAIRLAGYYEESIGCKGGDCHARATESTSLVAQLARLSEMTQIAHRTAMNEGRTDVADELGRLGMGVASAIRVTVQGENRRAS